MALMDRLKLLKIQQERDKEPIDTKDKEDQSIRSILGRLKASPIPEVEGDVFDELDEEGNPKKKKKVASSSLTRRTIPAKGSTIPTPTYPSTIAKR